MESKSIGIVGLGYWGPNLLRNFAAAEGWDVTFACDRSADRLDMLRKTYPSVQLTVSFEDLLADASLDAIVIATPPSQHAPMARAALEAGKHVLVEKPLATTADDAWMLTKLAKTKGKILLVDHTFRYEPAVQKMHEYVRNGEIGDLLYYDATRINLGLIQRDSNVLWDLAVHDLSILAGLVPLSEVKEVLAYGYTRHTKQTEMAHLHLTYRSELMAHIHVSWLSPVKIRQTFVGGSEKMIIYDDNQPSEKIRLYDKGVQFSKEDETFALPIYRSGDILIPAIQAKEPLRSIVEHFLACIEGREEPLTPGENGAIIVEILELADRSMKEQSRILRTI